MSEVVVDEEKVAASKEQLSLFKAEIAKLLPEDTTDDIGLQCFLDARKGDISKASIMFATMHKWRKHFDVDGYYQDFPADILEMSEKVVIGKLSGISKNGHPIYWQRTGQLYPGLHKYLTMGMVLSGHMKDMEDMMTLSREQTAKHGEVKKVINVIDVSGIGLSTRSLFPALKLLSKMDEDYYPERLHRTFVVNAPSIFSGLWGIIKGFLDPVVASKVVILSGQSSYLPKLLEEMDADLIPKQYGGTAEWDLPDVVVKEVVAFFDNLEEKEGMQPCTIAKGGEHEVEVEAAAPTHITWKYRTNYADLGFSVKFVSEDGKETDLVKHTKSGVADTLIMGSVAVPSKGKVTVVFDNKAAYFSASKVSLVVKETPTKPKHIDFGPTVPPGQ